MPLSFFRLQLLLLLVNTPPCLHAGLPRVMVTASQGSTATHLITCRAHTTTTTTRCSRTTCRSSTCYPHTPLSPSRVTQSSSSLLANWEAASSVRQTSVLPNTLFTAGSNSALYCSLLTSATASCTRGGCTCGHHTTHQYNWHILSTITVNSQLQGSHIYSLPSLFSSLLPPPPPSLFYFLSLSSLPSPPSSLIPPPPPSLSSFPSSPSPLSSPPPPSPPPSSLPSSLSFFPSLSPSLSLSYLPPSLPPSLLYLCFWVVNGGRFEDAQGQEGDLPW